MTTANDLSYFRHPEAQPKDLPRFFASLRMTTVNDLSYFRHPEAQPKDLSLDSSFRSE